MFIGFNMTENSLKTREARLTAYHRIIEAFKFAYAQRSELGDPEFEANVTQVWNVSLPLKTHRIKVFKLYF